MPVGAGAESLVQGDTCLQYSVSDPCYLNGCAKGYQGDLVLDPAHSCSFFCNPIDNWTGNIQGLAGDPAGITCATTFGGIRPDGPGAGYECVYIQSMYSDTEEIAETIGTCRPVATYGSCADFDWVQLQVDIQSGAVEASDYCENYPNRCKIECISIDTFESAYQTQTSTLQISKFMSKVTNLFD
jgi:hypothetical protein